MDTWTSSDTIAAVILARPDIIQEIEIKTVSFFTIIKYCNRP